MPEGVATRYIRLTLHTAMRKKVIKYMKAKRLTALLLSAVMAASLTGGCGGINKGASAAHFEDTDVELGLVNFIARYQQASYDDIYKMYFNKGDDLWTADLYGNGSTMKDDLVNGVMDSLKNIYTLERHMEEYQVTVSEQELADIKAAAEQFLADNSKKAIDAMGADQEYVEEYLRLSTIAAKMRKAMIADVDKEVSDEEAKTGTFSYVRVEKASESDDADSVSADMDALKEKVDQFAAEAKAGTLEDVAEDYEYTVSTASFTADDDTFDEAVITALRSAKEGAVSDVIDTDTYYYVVRLDKEMDREATDATKKSIVTERETTLYDETLEGWKEDIAWTVDEKAVGTITFDNLFTTTAESSQSGSETATTEEE